MGDLRVWCQLSVYPGACDGNGDLRDDEMEITDIGRLHKAFNTPALEAYWLKAKNSRLNMMWGLKQEYLYSFSATFYCQKPGKGDAIYARTRIRCADLLTF